MNLRLILFLCASSFTVLNIPVHAQITPDNTLGAERSRLNSFPGVTAIDGGARRVNNLFHSFTDFNVGAGQSVYFLNPTGVQNIFSRVTGKTTSNINGVLGVAGPANLFLLNPNGILFGPNARLDLSGSFVGTTATGIRFADQGVFSATQPEAPTLLTVQPSALLFNQLPAPIALQPGAALEVPFGSSINLIGGNLTLDGALLNAPGGSITVAGIAAPTEVGLTIGDQFRFSFPDVARADVSIARSLLNVGADPGGSIEVQARNFDLSDSSLLQTGVAAGTSDELLQAGDILIQATGATTIRQNSAIVTAIDSNASGNSGNITVNTGSLSITDSGSIAALIFGAGVAGNVTLNVQNASIFDGGSVSSGIITSNNADGIPAIGQTGAITINTGSLAVRNGASLLTFNSGGIGLANDITINARDAAVIQGAASRVATTTSDGLGNSGNITIAAGSLDVSNGAILGSGTINSLGNSGTVTINARDAVRFDGVGTQIFSGAQSSLGEVGDIRISAGSLSMTNGVYLATAALALGSSDKGKITIETTGSGVSLTNSSIVTIGLDNAGSVSVSAPNGTIALQGSPGTESAVLSLGIRGNAGPITLAARSIALDNSFVIAPTFGQGNAGKITVTARDRVSLNQAAIGASVYSFEDVGQFLKRTGVREIQGYGDVDSTIAQIQAVFSRGGKANDIDITARSLSLDRNSFISTDTTSGGSGNIRLQLSDLLLLRRGSKISTTAGTVSSTTGDTDFLGGGDGGNITINSPFIIAVPNEGSRISANAFTGTGGNVRINTQGLFGITAQAQQTTASSITASSRLGVQGQVTIAQPDVQPTQGTIELPITPIPGNQIAQACPRGNPDRPLGSFVVSGRGSAPSSPIEPLSGSPAIPLATAERTAPSAIAPPERSPQIIEAQRWTKSPDGTVQLVAQTPQSLNLPEFAACAPSRQK